MIGYKQVLCALLLTTLSGVIIAQNNTNSPYTRYGLGQLSDQSFGNSKAMGGIAFGLRNGSQINPLNPASYTAIDSLTFLFDGGVTFQNTNLSDGNVKMNAKNSSFDYIAMQFRLQKRLAMSVGLLPFSSVGYNFTTQNSLSNSVTTQNTYSGNGTIYQLYAGLGVKIVEGLSLGTNISYLSGTIDHSSILEYSDGSTFASSKVEQIKIQDYKLDVGVQYTQKFGNKHSATLGAIYSLGHKLNNNSYRKIIKTTSSESIESSDIHDYEFDLPHMFGIGASYVYDKRLTIGADYSLQKWSKAKYFSENGQYYDKSKYSIGAEYIPSFTGRSYFSLIRYRIGAYYSDPYIKINQMEGAREFGVSAGFGLPVFNSNSILNISAHYIKVTPKISGMIKENYMKINVGLTFNERWFAKWKVQ